MSEQRERTTASEGDGKAAGLERRGFLRGLGVAAGGAAAVVPVVLGSGVAEAAESPEEQVKGRYQESDHVKNYYHLNRL
ncbi:MAG TPA: twin-arginine translocation signal domain-containing protein [Geminicoccaceae bacterium]